MDRFLSAVRLAEEQICYILDYITFWGPFQGTVFGENVIGFPNGEHLERSHSLCFQPLDQTLGLWYDYHKERKEKT